MNKKKKKKTKIIITTKKTTSASPFLLRNLLAGFVMLFIFIFAIGNIELAVAPTQALLEGENEFPAFVEKIQERYISDDLKNKNWFINLNGLFARVSGRRQYNEVVKTENDMLMKPIGERDMQPLAEAVIEFEGYLQEKNIPFLFVQIPYKEDLKDEMLPAGVVSYANENAEALVEELKKNEVPVLDLRPIIAESPETIKQYFYKTDHHWNPHGAFIGFQELLKELQQQYPDRGIDLWYAERENWEVHTKEDWFLGSRGKRVGKFFGGVDDLIWYTPVFETEMTCMIPKKSEVHEGDFFDANIREKYIHEKNYFGYNAYCVYIGGDYPLVHHRNDKAPSDLKILCLKDSSTIPLQAFLSTVFQDIDVIDPRHYKETTIVEYIEETQPDMIIMGMNPSQFHNKVYREFGVEEFRNPSGVKEISEEIFEDMRIEIPEKETGYNYVEYPVEKNTAYKLSIRG